MNTCPICHARLGDPADENPTCARCGAKLTPLWEVIRRSRQWLQRACAELVQADWDSALNSLAQPQGFRRSDLAEQLEIFCRERGMKYDTRWLEWGHRHLK